MKKRTILAATNVETYQSWIYDERLKFGRELSDLRKKRELSQRGLAEISGIPQSTIWKIENGKLSFGFDVLLQILRGLNSKINFSSKQ